MESIFSNSEEEKLELNDFSIQHLKETAKWGKFLAIIHFVGIGLIVIIALSLGVFLPEINDAMSQGVSMPVAFTGTVLMITYLIMAVIMFFPGYYLFKYSVKLKKAIREKNSELLMEAFTNQKSLYKYIGVLSIIMIGLYAIGIIGITIGSLFAAI